MRLLVKAWQRCVKNDRFFSPSGLLFRAAAIAAAFLICHALGLRQYTTIASGTAPVAFGGQSVGAALGILYIASYFGFVLLAPVLVLAAGLLALYHGLLLPKVRPSDASAHPPAA
jgi:hypothetical protein